MSASIEIPFSGGYARGAARYALALLP